jgi:hypothetical protein
MMQNSSSLNPFDQAEAETFQFNMVRVCEDVQLPAVGRSIGPR